MRCLDSPHIISLLFYSEGTTQSEGAIVGVFKKKILHRGRFAYVFTTKFTFSFILFLLTIPALPADIAAWQAACFLGFQSASENNLTKAEEYYTRGVQFAEAFGPADSRLGSTLNSLGVIYHRRGKNRDAIRVYLRAYRILDHVYGALSLDVGNISLNIASAYFDDGQYARSEWFFHHALSIFDMYFIGDSLKTAQAAFGAAEANRLLRRYDQAIPLVTRAADIWERSLGLVSPEVAAALHSLALVYAAQGKHKEAEGLSKLIENITAHAQTLSPKSVTLPQQRQ